MYYKTVKNQNHTSVTTNRGYGCLQKKWKQKQIYKMFPKKCSRINKKYFKSKGEINYENNRKNKQSGNFSRTCNKG